MPRGMKRKKAVKLPIWEVLTAALLGCVLTVVLMLCLSLMLYWEWLRESAIPVGNLIIKLLAAVLTGFWIGRTVKERAWLIGGAASVTYLAFSVLLMSLFLGEFSFSWDLLSDLLLCFVTGAVSAALVRYRKEKRSA